jgi:hypothetical protein
MATAMLIAAGRLFVRLIADRGIRPEHEACAYMTLVGAISAAVYAISRCGAAGPMRYDMLSILGAIGLGAWYLCIERSRVLRTVWIALVAVWISASVVGHARLWSEYLTNPPIGVKRQIIGELQARGVRYASSDYWIAYYVSFLTKEQIIVMSNDFHRILEYERVIDAHRNETVLISRTPCSGGQEVIPRVYFCPP